MAAKGALICAFTSQTTVDFSQLSPKEASGQKAAPGLNPREEPVIGGKVAAAANQTAV
jgi:hypothetical protein